jgi:phenol hydroxylase P1 protein
MQIDLRTVTIPALRQTFGHLARRMGADKPATRYMEATMDLQPVENFHYRPTWEPEFDIFDTRRTAIVMKDWYALKDPRQYYYGTWTLARARMQETAEGDFELVEQMGLAGAYPVEGRRRALRVLLPLRHVAWAANLNDATVASYSYGIAMSQATCYAAMDQLGIAQYLTRIAMAFDCVDELTVGKKAWIEDPAWQGLRRFVEDLMVEKDWFGILFAQDFVLNGLLYPLVFEQFNDELNRSHGPVFALLTRFPCEWHGESAKWVDAVVKVAAAESPENKALLRTWLARDLERVQEALEPIAKLAFGEGAAVALSAAQEQLESRVAKCGLAS